MSEFIKEEDECIFIRLATKKEVASPAEKTKGLQSIPEKKGYEVVYKPYGTKGRGFYYIPLSDKTPKHILDTQPET